MKQVMASQLYFNLKECTPLVENAYGKIIAVTSEDVPGFVNISFVSVELTQNGCVQPIWHPNAHKLVYCTEGNVLVTMRTPTAIEKFKVEKGEMFFIPQGYVHSIENIGGKSTLICALSHVQPEAMHLSNAIGSISDSVFNDTFNTQKGFVEGLKHAKLDEILVAIKEKQATPAPSTNQYKFNIGSSDKPILTNGGYLQLGTKKNLPMLDGLAILGFGLNPKGAVEPHWHTNAGELVYIISGKTRITVLAPDGNVETVEVNGGEGIFAPASHFHNIENIGDANVEVIAFFSHAEPDYMGIGEVVGAYSNEMLAAIFNVDPKYFDAFKKPEVPLVIVPE